MMFLQSVAPLAGAWIEIILSEICEFYCKSLPSRERGLKFMKHCSETKVTEVAPLAGAWIEICLLGAEVASAGSLPSRERGLK